MQVLYDLVLNGVVELSRIRSRWCLQDEGGIGVCVVRTSFKFRPHQSTSEANGDIRTYIVYQDWIQVIVDQGICYTKDPVRKSNAVAEQQ